MQHFMASAKESLQSVLPIAAIVLILSITFAPLNSGVLVLFLFGTLLLICGMGFFTIGSTISMEPLGEGIGITISKSKKWIVGVVICFVLGAIITIAEPDLTVLAEQVPSIPNMVLILSVAVGVGIFLAVALIRIKKGTALSKLLIVFYALIIILAFFAPKEFVPTAFDSGGVTTGPITVPFIMALGAGMATMSRNKHSSDDSFGLVALCSIGPILSVIVLSLCFPAQSETTPIDISKPIDTIEAIKHFTDKIPHYMKEVLIAFVPLIAVFVIFQLISRRFHRHQILRISVGFVYTYIGLVLFLTGANVGFMPAGKLIGEEIAKSEFKYLLIPIGMLMGYFVVSAEPAVHSLKRQVMEVTNGAITQKAVGLALSIGVAVSVGISMLRVLTGVPILPFLIVGYLISLVISFFVPPIYTGIAFDSGGVASGPMTTTFMLPFAVGACAALGGDIMTDAFGIVAMIAMTPLITIQVLGLSGNIRRRRRIKKAQDIFSLIPDEIVYFQEEASA